MFISLAVLNCCYGFEGTFTRLGDYRFISRRLGDGWADSNRFAHSFLGNLPVPLPAPYVQGFDSQKRDEEKKLVRIVGGRLERGGDLLGPLFTLATKLPPGSLGLIGASVVLYLTRRRRAAVEAVVLPAIVFLGLLATQTGLNWAFRYALPALPFLFVAVGSVVRPAWSSRHGRLFVLLCLAWNMYELVSIMPNYLSYGNLFVGGSARAHRYFLGSNYDWGQDVLRLKRWADEHPQAKPLVYGCYGAISPQSVGLSVIGLPMGPPGLGQRGAPELGFEPYYLAVSTNMLHGLPSPVPRDRRGDALHAIAYRRSLEELKPVARVGGSILIYRIDSLDYDVFIDPTEAMPMDGATP